LVVPGDLEMLALRLTQLLEDEALRKGMGDAGRMRVEENYSFEAYRVKLKALLHDTES
jgi:glycosyltransferase involved in cell wall biosynthesis